MRMSRGDGLDGAIDPVGRTAGSSSHEARQLTAELASAPGFQPGEVPLAGCPQSGVAAVELLVVGELFAMLAVGSADGGDGALIGPVPRGRESPGRGRPGRGSGEPQGVPSGRAKTCTFIPCFCEE